jgi:hypothetical protein
MIGRKCRGNVGRCAHKNFVAIAYSGRVSRKLHDRIEGLPHAEVAQIMGISRSGVEKHLAVALRHLRGRLQFLVNADCGSPGAAASDNARPGGRKAPGKEPQ